MFRVSSRTFTIATTLGKPPSFPCFYDTYTYLSLIDYSQAGGVGQGSRAMVFAE